MDDLLHVLISGASSLVAPALMTLGASSLPLLLFAAAPYRSRWRLSLSLAFVLTASITVLLFLGRVTVLGMVVALGALAYYLLALLLLFQFITFARREKAGKPAVFLVSALLCVLIPAFPLRYLHSVWLLALGWSLTLCSYSYAVELLRSSSKAGFADFLFFTSVDPTLSYCDRSRPACVRTTVIVKRLLRGVLCVLLGKLTLKHWPRLITRITAHVPPEVPEEVLAVLSTLVLFLSVYWLRSGVAHVRIGLMQAVGFQPPECFRQPYLAKSPLDFWRRWNCWVGAWVQRYIFVPTSLWLMRKSLALAPRLSTTPARSAALVISFLAMGALHDWLLWAAQGALLLVYMRVFIFAAFGLLAWELIEGRIKKHQGSSLLPSASMRVAFSTAFRAAYASGVFVLSISLW